MGKSIINHQPSTIGEPDDIVFYDGAVRSTNAGDGLAICNRGVIYVGGSLSAHAGGQVRWMRIGYGATSGRLVLEPCGEGVEGALPVRYKDPKSPGSGIRVQSRRVLERFGLLPKATVRMQGIWTGQRIVAIVPPQHAPKPPEETLQIEEQASRGEAAAAAGIVVALRAEHATDRPPRKAAAKRRKRTANHEEHDGHEETVAHLPGCGTCGHTRNRGRGIVCTHSKSLEAGVVVGRADVCKRHEPKPQSNGPEEAEADAALTAMPQKPACLRCAHYGPNSEKCGSARGPHFGGHTSPRDSCDFFVPWKTTLPKEPGPNGRVEANAGAKPPPGRVKVPRPRAVCGHCGTDLAVTGRGIIPHDTNGVAYIAGRGDRDNPCRGSHSKGKLA